VANFASSFASAVDTNGKFATGVNDTGGKFASSINDTGGKFATTGVHDWWQIMGQYQAAETVK
jgi:hypothetical protein